MTGDNYLAEMDTLLPISRYLNIFRQSWFSGALFILLVLTALAVLYIDIQDKRHRVLYTETIGHMHEYTQYLALTSRKVMSADKTAFERLQKDWDQLKQYSNLLQHGGTHREEMMPALSEWLSGSELETFQETLHAQEKRIRLILENENTLISLTETIKQIDNINDELQKKLRGLSIAFAEKKHSPDDVIAVETIRTLIQFITGNLSTILQRNSPLPAMAGYPTEVTEQVADMTDTFIKGRDWLNTLVPDSDDFSESMSAIQTRFDTLESLLHQLQQLIPEAKQIQETVYEVFSAGETLSVQLNRVGQAVAEQSTERHNNLTLFFYVTVILAIIAGLFFVYSFSTSMRRYIFQEEQENERTQNAILRLLDEMEGPASGDLTSRMAVTEDITGTIADSINLTIETLQGLVGKINQAGTRVIDASAQAEQVSIDLLDAAQIQANKIEETVVAVLGMAEALESVSGSAEECADVARQTLRAAEGGADAVHDAMAGMGEIRVYIQETAKRIKRLGESSQEIGEIVTLISDITEQTNVLALNAAIQATAAGNAGKGFSVIAQEIQRLAEHSAEASRQINTLVRNIRGDTQDTVIAMERSTAAVVEGTRRASTTSQALEEIEVISKRLAQLVIRISEATTTQTKAAGKLARNMEDILLITRQTGQGTQQNVDSVRDMAECATALKSSVANFRV